MALLLRESDVKSLLTMRETMDWVETSLQHLSEGTARNVPRQRVKMPTGNLHILPAADLAEGVVGLKSYTATREGTRFMVVLYSSESGRLLSLTEADYMGVMRTGAASGIATKYMARQDADVLALFGTGKQAHGQLLAVATARPLRQVRVFGRDEERRRNFAAEMASESGVEVVSCTSVAETLEGASIVCTATRSREPVFPAEAIQKGVHINAAGSNSLLSRELDEKLVKNAAMVVVDSRVQARSESGDLLIPTERGWLDWDQLPELSDLVSGRIQGRASDDDITIFESLGLGIEDVAVAAQLYRKAKEAGIGEEIRLLED